MKRVYTCFSTDIIHSGHIKIINNASKLGEVYVGVLPDEEVASYKRFPLLPYDERVTILSNIRGVSKVVRQNTLSYAENIRLYKPDYVVHGDDWKTGVQKPVRDEVIEVLKEYGGELVEYSYSQSEEQRVIDDYSKSQLSLPDMRRGMLKKLFALKGFVSVIEAHNGITGLLAEKTKVLVDGSCRQFDAMWISSLCDSTAKGKPDIELIDLSLRLQTVNEIMEVTTKPIIFDGDTGGLPEHLAYNIKTLERIGVSAIIIEDKTGLKKNSLFGTQVEQTQDSIVNFCNKLSVAASVKKTNDFMVIARVESLILEKGMDDALNRARAYVSAGADGVMIHSRRKEPDEIFEFTEKFRASDPVTPLVVVPTSFNSVTEDEFKAKGINAVIYANQLTRSAFPSMRNVCETILRNRRALEADEQCLSIKEIINLIPVE